MKNEWTIIKLGLTHWPYHVKCFKKTIEDPLDLLGFEDGIDYSINLQPWCKKCKQVAPKHLWRITYTIDNLLALRRE